VTATPLRQLGIGAGLRGLAAMAAHRRSAPDAEVLLVDRAARPGGSAHTQRSEGFVCELGRFAFSAEESAALSAPLTSPPPMLAALPGADSGSCWRNGALQPTALAMPPLAPRNGCEDLVQAYRRELGATLRLGREALAIERTDTGYAVELGGDVRDVLTADAVTLALPLPAASRLLAPFDGRLATAAAQLRTTPRAYVFLGFWQSDLGSGLGNDLGNDLGSALAGYGVLADDGPCAEAIFCTNVFANRAQTGKALVRMELSDVPDDHETAAALALAMLRTWTGVTAAPIFRRVHPFTADVRDGAFLECRVRLHDLADRLPGLRVL
jgi:protoporphyrinogen oxidase